MLRLERSERLKTGTMIPGCPMRESAGQPGRKIDLLGLLLDQTDHVARSGLSTNGKPSAGRELRIVCRDFRLPKVHVVCLEW
jgi:hypothetical protein